MRGSFRIKGLKFFSSLVLFRALLDLSYVIIISPIFSYAGFTYSPSPSNYALSWVLLLFSFSLIRQNLTKVSDYFFFLAIMSVFMPITTLYGFDSDRDVIVVLIVLASLSLVHWVTDAKFVSFRQLPEVRYGVSVVVLISSIFVTFLIAWYYTSGVDLNLNFTKVYEFRRPNAELASGGILSYTNNWTYKVFSVTLFAIALLYKRYVLLVFIFLIQVYFYAASAHKSVFFLPIMILGIFYYVRSDYRAISLSLVFSSLIIFSIFSYFMAGDIIISSLFSRRVFFVPAHATFTYFEFFKDNPNVYWSNSFLSPFLHYPYDLQVPQVIGRYLGNAELSANNGYIPSGYAHAGLLGVIFYSLILGLILKLINDFTINRLPLWFAVALSIVPLRSVLTASDLTVVIVTHGLFIVLIIIFLLRSKRYALTQKIRA